MSGKANLVIQLAWFPVSQIFSSPRAMLLCRKNLTIATTHACTVPQR
jgi:hypothetical protein